MAAVGILAAAERATAKLLSFSFVKGHSVLAFRASTISLFASLPRVQAQETIFLGNYETTDYERVYQLYKLTYEDEDRAETAQVDAFKRYDKKSLRS